MASAPSDITGSQSLVRVQNLATCGQRKRWAAQEREEVIEGASPFRLRCTWERNALHKTQKPDLTDATSGLSKRVESQYRPSPSFLQWPSLSIHCWALHTHTIIISHYGKIMISLCIFHVINYIFPSPQSWKIVGK